MTAPYNTVYLITWIKEFNRFYWVVAQLVERGAVNSQVTGSSPVCPANFKGLKMTEYFIYRSEDGRFLGKNFQKTYIHCSPVVAFSTDEILKISKGQIKEIEKKGFKIVECYNLTQV